MIDYEVEFTCDFDTEHHPCDLRDGSAGNRRELSGQLEWDVRSP